MRPHFLIAWCLASAMLVTASLPAQAAAAKKHTAAESGKKKTAAPKFIPNSSQESTGERERRLLRECKGRPNAGACSGYTS